MPKTDGPRVGLSDLSPEQIKVWQRAARNVWSDIGMDCLDAKAMMENLTKKGKRHTRDSVTMSRDEVIEVVLDAGRMLDQPEVRKDPMLVAFYENPKNVKEHEIPLKEVFKYTDYGM